VSLVDENQDIYIIKIDLAGRGRGSQKLRCYFLGEFAQAEFQELRLPIESGGAPAKERDSNSRPSVQRFFGSEGTVGSNWESLIPWL
jgi:hypothetical protein